MLGIGWGRVCLGLGLGWFGVALGLLWVGPGRFEFGWRGVALGLLWAGQGLLWFGLLWFCFGSSWVCFGLGGVCFRLGLMWFGVALGHVGLGPHDLWCSVHMLINPHHHLQGVCRTSLLHPLPKRPLQVAVARRARAKRPEVAHRSGAHAREQKQGEPTRGVKR